MANRFRNILQGLFWLGTGESANILPWTERTEEDRWRRCRTDCHCHLVNAHRPIAISPTDIHDDGSEA